MKHAFVEISNDEQGPPLESFAFKTKSKGIISVPHRLDHPLEDDDFQVTKGHSRGRSIVVDKSDEEFEPIVENERNVVAPLSDENESVRTGLQHAKVVDIEDVVEIDPNLEEEHAEDDVIANVRQSVIE